MDSPENTPYQPPETATDLSQQPKTSAKAIWAFVLGLFGPCTCITALPGLILGIMATVQIGKPENLLKGQGFAVTGIVLSALSIFLAPIFLSVAAPTYTKAVERARMLKEVANISVLVKGMKIYAANHEGKYPETLEQLKSEVFSDQPDVQFETDFGFDSPQPYILVPGSTDNSPSNTPIINAPWVVSKKTVIGYSGGHVKIERVE